MEVSTVSWNINSIKARSELLIAYLKSSKPDILCLQELKCETDKVPFDEIEQQGYHCVAHGQKTYNGVAILSREPLELISTKLGAEELDQQARLIHARTFDLDIVNVYVPNGEAVTSEKYLYKLQWLAQLKTYLDETFSEEDQYVLCGDFNVAADDRDVYDPSAFEGRLLYSEPERQALKALREDRLVDVFRQFETGANHFSWWDYRRMGYQLGKGLRIDYVFASEALAEFSLAAWIDEDQRGRERPSDHAPVGANFELE